MELADVRPLAIFDGLTDEQLGELVDAGTEVGITCGEDLFRQGEHADHWWLLVDGAVAGSATATRASTVASTRRVRLSSDSVLTS